MIYAAVGCFESRAPLSPLTRQHYPKRQQLGIRQPGGLMPRDQAGEREKECREEAERLAQLPVADQKEILALYRECATNSKTPKRERAIGPFLQ
jgi:hypothetical protein